MSDLDDDGVDHASLIATLRAAALLLERANTVYDYHLTNGTWSPRSLRYEADYLEKNA